METRNLTVTGNGVSICGKVYREARQAERPERPEKPPVILSGHGFGGDKDSKTTLKLAEEVLMRRKDALVVAFDWPCHGADSRTKLNLTECDAYLREMVRYAREELHAARVYYHGVSYGAYLALRYIKNGEDPFSRIVLRSPALTIRETIYEKLIGEKERQLLEKGKPVQIGFGRKMKMTKEFLDQLEEGDVTKLDFSGEAEKMLIIHGKKDELIDPEAVREFAEKNDILMIEIEGAGHRFQDPREMHEAVSNAAEWMIEDMEEI